MVLGLSMGCAVACGGELPGSAGDSPAPVISGVDQSVDRPYLLERVGEALHRQPLPELASRAYKIARQLETGPRWEATLKMLERVASGG